MFPQRCFLYTGFVLAALAVSDDWTALDSFDIDSSAVAGSFESFTGSDSGSGSGSSDEALHSVADSAGEADVTFDQNAHHLRRRL